MNTAFIAFDQTGCSIEELQLSSPMNIIFLTIIENYEIHSCPEAGGAYFISCMN